MKRIVIPSLLLLLVACGTKKNATQEPMIEEVQENAGQKPQRNAMVESIIGSFEENSDPLEIDSMRVEGNKLFLFVHYGGGCREHQFKMIGSPMVMKTYPPKRMVQLVHDNEDDPCESIVNRVLEADLRNLAYEQQPGSTIMLQLSGTDDVITYTYE